MDLIRLFIDTYGVFVVPVVVGMAAFQVHQGIRHVEVRGALWFIVPFNAVLMFFIWPSLAAGSIDWKRFVSVTDLGNAAALVGSLAIEFFAWLYAGYVEAYIRICWWPRVIDSLKRRARQFSGGKSVHPVRRQQGTSRSAAGPVSRPARRTQALAHAVPVATECVTAEDEVLHSPALPGIVWLARKARHFGAESLVVEAGLDRRRRLVARVLAILPAKPHGAGEAACGNDRHLVGVLPPMKVKEISKVQSAFEKQGWAIQVEWDRR